MMAEVLLPLGSGRSLHVYIHGSPADPVLFFHHGSSGHGPELPLIVEPALAAGFQLVEVMRPGYLKSTSQTGRRVSDSREWFEVVLDHLGADEFWVSGHSGGGPYTMAMAYYFGDECRGALSLAGVAPSHEPTLNFTEGMQPESVEYLWPADRSRAAIEKMAESWATSLSGMTFEQFMFDDGRDPERWLSEKYGREFYDGMRKAVSMGWRGTAEDIEAFQSPWGFDVREIRVPTTVVGGVKDYAVPIGHARWLAAHIPDARLFEYPEDGHSAVLCSGYVKVLNEWAEAR